MAKFCRNDFDKSAKSVQIRTILPTKRRYITPLIPSYCPLVLLDYNRHRRQLTRLTERIVRKLRGQQCILICAIFT